MEATPTLVINYFSGFKQNLVPLFQRPYTWSEKQWRTLWEDVMVFYPADEANDKATHFMGAVVTMPARSVCRAIESPVCRYWGLRELFSWTLILTPVDFPV